MVYQARKLELEATPMITANPNNNNTTNANLDDLTPISVWTKIHQLAIPRRVKGAIIRLLQTLSSSPWKIGGLICIGLMNLYISLNLH